MPQRQLILGRAWVPSLWASALLIRCRATGETWGLPCGLLTQNVFRLPRKRKCQRRDVEIAGVGPDGILSCVRQQVRGYVIDFCSVIGCTPTSCEQQVAWLEQLLNQPGHEPELKRALETTLEMPGPASRAV